jgi:hypothetical protein
MDVGADGQQLAWWLGLGLALYRFRRPERWRFAAALAVGAAAGPVGWIAWHADRVPTDLASFADPTRGFSVLFVPLGAWLASWTSVRPVRRRAFLAEALRVLPLALATARLGCLAAGCCGGVAVEHVPDVVWPLVSAFGGTRSAPFDHPTALYEASGLVLLHAVLARVPADQVPACFALGFASIRLAVEPLRAVPPLGPPSIPAAWIAAAWWGTGLGGMVGRVPVRDFIRRRGRRSRGAGRRPPFPA